MLYIRPLIYEEKSLDDFDIDSEDSVFNSFYKALLNLEGTKASDKNAEETITELFNEACYIITVANLVKRPELKLGLYIDFCVPDYICTVLIMVYYMLYDIKNDNKHLDALQNNIDHYIRENYNNQLLYDCFSDYWNPILFFPKSIDFKPRTITNITETVDNLDDYWKKQILRSNEREIENFVCLWKEPHGRNQVIDVLLHVMNNYHISDDFPF